MSLLDSFPGGYKAIVIGATGGVGAALRGLIAADERCSECALIGRTTSPDLDLLDEHSIERTAGHFSNHGPFHLIIDATGVLHDSEMQPEKTIDAVDPSSIARSFAINATGPLLLMKHFRNLLPQYERSVFATISAKIGSIGDNQLGGWYGYRASKAALNMFVKTASIEIARTRPLAVCLALHPGTVRTRLSEPFAGNRALMEPEESAERLLSVINHSNNRDTGSFLTYDGMQIPW